MTENAEVVGVYPNRIRIVVGDLERFRIEGEPLRVGSYVRVPSDDGETILIAIIENFCIETVDEKTRRYAIDAMPLGLVREGRFIRGGDSIALPPKEAEPATLDEIIAIYASCSSPEVAFSFSSLVTSPEVRVAVDGNKFFNKHIAIVGSTGSGKSHTVCRILQSALAAKLGEFDLNNSHILIFDLHAEYKSGFKSSNHLGVDELVLPYWLLDSEELEDVFLDTESNDHNQRYIFREAVVASKKTHFKGDERARELLHYGSPTFFELKDIINQVDAKNREMIPTKTGERQGPMFGKLSNFLGRFEAKINDPRFDFLLGERARSATYADTLKLLLGFGNARNNVTILDLSGIPFEVLSVTVSLVTRMMFHYGYLYKRQRLRANSEETLNNDVPVLLVYEEAHKYVPNSNSSKFRASRTAIERIAKEGRKYGVTLLLSSQRPAEISDTIFSQCNNFIVMRLTNANDQNYVKRLLPDTLGNIIDSLPTLQAGEALLMGESVVLPSLVTIDRCDDGAYPSSSDVPFWDLWRQEWKSLDIEGLEDELLR